MILTINGGSSSLKFAVFSSEDPPKRTLGGKFERIGLPDALFSLGDGNRAPQHVEAPDHASCLPLMVAAVEGQKIEAVVHRIVHGGPRNFEPAVVDGEILRDLHDLAEVVPEHLPAQITLIEALKEHYSGVPHIACFDTGFHKDMPRVAQMISIPRKYFENGIRRYGFHGLSYSFLMGELSRIAGAQAANGRVILAHLGNGCSMAAVRGGKPVETTMGFTPAAGLVMSRRSGDLDPGIVAYLARTEGMMPEDFNRMINTRSGLLGISGTTSDVRDLLEREKNDSRAAEALELFCYQAQKWIGALTVVCGGLDTLVFSGGIGENSPEMRARICSGVRCLGVELDSEANRCNQGIISGKASHVTVRVIPTDEEVYMAKSALPFRNN